MKEITITIDGEEYIAVKKHWPESAGKPWTGYERCVDGATCLVDTGYRGYKEIREFGEDADDGAFDNGNYYNEEILAENVVRADTLMRKLRQWQALNDEPVDWSDAETNKWKIGYDYDGKNFDVDYYNEYRCLGQIYFSSVEKAREAIEVFKDELTWYFTEYQQRLDEPKRN